jgi:Mce-associated membrane protein
VTARTRRPLVVAIAAGVVIAVLAVLGVLQVISVRHHDDLDNRRRAAIAAGSDEVSQLLTLSQSTATQVLHRLLDGATAGFHDQLEKQAKAFQQTIVTGKVVSKGSIASAGLASMKGDKAVVVVAAKAVVRNASSKKAGARNYRLTVTVQEVGGHWLVAGLTFVV